jgi:hypothetical protein
MVWRSAIIMVMSSLQRDSADLQEPKIPSWLPNLAVLARYHDEEAVGPVLADEGLLTAAGPNELRRPLRRQVGQDLLDRVRRLRNRDRVTYTWTSLPPAGWER